MLEKQQSRRGGRRRANGEGSLYKIETPAGLRFEIKIWDENGKRLARRFKTEKEARAALKDALARHDAGQAVLPRRHTMNELFDAWLAQLRDQVERGERSYTTWRQYESYVREHMRPALGRTECRKLTTQQVEQFLAALPLSAQTRANLRTVLRRGLNVAKRWGWVDPNPVEDTDPIPVRKRRVEPLSLDDAQRFLDVLRDEPLYSAFVVALYSGLRAGELAALRVEDIDLTAARMYIHQQIQPVKGEGLTVKPLKTEASTARLNIIPEAPAVLSDQIGDRTEGYVWESAPGHPYWPTSYTQALSRALKRAGLPHVRLHDLRHFFVSFLPQLDVHPAVAQKLSRHGNSGTTLNVYTSVQETLQKQAMGKLHEALQNAVGRSTGRSDGEILRVVG